VGEVEIRGGAGPYEAAAIIAVIQRLLDEAAAARNRLTAPPLPPAWVRAGRSPEPEDPYAEVVPDPHRPL
jgi:hypothetical protein